MKTTAPEQVRSRTEFVRSVCTEYGADLHRFLLSRLRHDQDARDVAQEVYLRMLRFSRSELVREPHAYVFHIACQIIGQFRLRSRRDLVTYDSEMAQHQADHPTESTPDVLAEQLSAQHQLQHLLRELSAVHREVFLMRHCDGASRAEIAQKLNLSVHTVKKYLTQASAHLSTARWRQGKDG